MAAKKKAAKAGAAAAAPYVQRVISDEELRDNVRVAVDSAREAFTRLQSGKSAPKTVLDDKKFHKNVSEAALRLKDASDALRDGPKKSKKRKGGLMRKLLFLVVAGGVAVAVSEDLRNKVLDALFGKEEEFDYTSSTAPASPPPTAAASTSSSSGDGAGESASEDEPANASS